MVAGDLGPLLLRVKRKRPWLDLVIGLAPLQHDVDAARAKRVVLRHISALDILALSGDQIGRLGLKDSIGQRDPLQGDIIDRLLGT